MAAGFDGWWVNGRTGKGYHVAEHWMEVRSDPERFGMTEDMVNAILKKAKGRFSPGDTSEEGQRYLLLAEVMKRGWVRVRGYRGKYSIELSGNAEVALPKVFSFLKNAGVHSNSEILINDIASKFSKRYEDGMRDAMKDLKMGRIPNVSPTKEISDPRDEGGIDTRFTDAQKRERMRQRLGQRHGIPDPSPGEGMIPERCSLSKGFRKLFG